jgi:hypothetical protein
VGSLLEVVEDIAASPTRSRIRLLRKPGGRARLLGILAHIIDPDRRDVPATLLEN